MQTDPGRFAARPGLPGEGDRAVHQGPRQLHRPARPRPPRHAQEHEQPRRGLPGAPASSTVLCRSSRRRWRSGRRSSAPTTPTHSASMNNLADSYQAAGKLDRCSAAARGDAGAEEDEARPRPPRHAHQHEQPRRGLPAAGQLDRGSDALRGDAALKKAKLGPDHPDTLASMNNLAIATQTAGQARPGAAAVRGDAGADEGEARPRPPRHARSSMNNLAESYQDAGKLDGLCRSSRRRWR